LERYITGLLTDLDRKNCDTIAAAVAGTSTERLQHLLTDAQWDPQELDALRVRRLSQKSPKGGILLIDDTSFPKKGSRSVGVGRQYCGELGKVANCQVVVSAQYVADELRSSCPLHWPLSGRVYLPKEEWANDTKRRERAHVPEEIAFETKPQIALSMIEQAREWGVPFEFVVADAGYGDNPSFLEGLEKREVGYVCAVESTFGVRLPEEVVAAKECSAAPLHSAQSVLGDLPEQAWQTVTWREGTKGQLGKQMVALRAHRATGSSRHSTSHSSSLSTGPEGWLIGERPLPKEDEDAEEKQAETKYYFCNLAQETTLERLAELAHSRWSIEQFYEDAKGEVGLGDYQGRRWDGLHRHLALVMLAYSYLMLQSTSEGEEAASLEEGFSPLSAKTEDAAGDPPAGNDVAARGSGGVVHQNGSNKELPST
jgi:SRSO17 transposase